MATTLEGKNFKRKKLLMIIVGGVLILYIFAKVIGFWSQANERAKNKKKIKAEKIIVVRDPATINTDQIAAIDGQFKNLSSEIKKQHEATMSKINKLNEDIELEIISKKTKEEQYNKRFKKVENAAELTNSRIGSTINKVGQMKDKYDKSINNLKTAGKKKTLVKVIGLELPPLPTSITGQKENNASTIIFGEDNPDVEISTEEGEEKVSRILSTPIKSMNDSALAVLAEGIQEGMEAGAASPIEPPQVEPPKIYSMYLGRVKAITLNGADAPTGAEGDARPYPIMLKIDGVLKEGNSYFQDFKGCNVLGSIRGHLQDERAHIMLSKISCVTDGGRKVLKGNINGWVIGEDGKVGLPGRVVEKSTKIIGKALMSGFADGIAQAFTNAPAIMTPGGETTAQGGSSSMVSGVAGGGGSAFKILAEHYIQMAKDIYPIVEVKAGRKVELIIKDTVVLEEVERNAVFISEFGDNKKEVSENTATMVLN